jgi:hypothetical protein
MAHCFANNKKSFNKILSPPSYLHKMTKKKGTQFSNNNRKLKYLVKKSTNSFYLFPIFRKHKAIPGFVLGN